MTRSLAFVLLGASLAASLAAAPCRAGGAGTELHDEPLPPQVEQQPRRPRPLLELGEPFLSTGTLSEGWRLPTGATWRPQLLLFGTWRTAAQGLKAGEREVAEWANRLDLFANLRLSGTERLLVGLRPLDEDGEFAGYRFEDDPDWTGGFDAELRTAFFEGDFGEIFPRLDRADRRPLDLGFSIGRQPIRFQDGLLIDDVVDSFGLVKNSLRPSGSSNLRVTALHAWDEVNRPFNGAGDESHPCRLTGIFTALDLPSTTLEFDAVHVDAGHGRPDGFVAGVGATQRLGRFSTTFRALLSTPYDEKGPGMDDGQVLFGELSWTPRRTHDVAYLTVFAVEGTFTPAARDPDLGGPLARAGILYEAPGMGRLGSPLSAAATDAAGFALGWQRIRAHGRRQLVLELAGRTSTAGVANGEAAVGARFQQALGRRSLLQLDAFASAGEGRSAGYGARVEWTVKF